MSRFVFLKFSKQVAVNSRQFVELTALFAIQGFITGESRFQYFLCLIRAVMTSQKMRILNRTLDKFEFRLFLYFTG